MTDGRLITDSSGIYPQAEALDGTLKIPYNVQKGRVPVT